MKRGLFICIHVGALLCSLICCRAICIAFSRFITSLEDKQTSGIFTPKQQY